MQMILNAANVVVLVLLAFAIDRCGNQCIGMKIIIIITRKTITKRYRSTNYKKHIGLCFLYEVAFFIKDIDCIFYSILHYGEYNIFT